MTMPEARGETAITAVEQQLTLDQEVRHQQRLEQEANRESHARQLVRSMFGVDHEGAEKPAFVNFSFDLGSIYQALPDEAVQHQDSMSKRRNPREKQLWTCGGDHLRLTRGAGQENPTDEIIVARYASPHLKLVLGEKEGQGPALHISSERTTTITLGNRTLYTPIFELDQYPGGRIDALYYDRDVDPFRSGGAYFILKGKERSFGSSQDPFNNFDSLETAYLLLERFKAGEFPEANFGNLQIAEMSINYTEFHGIPARPRHGRFPYIVSPK
jgi:hypothetical protein